MTFGQTSFNLKQMVLVSDNGWQLVILVYGMLSQSGLVQMHGLMAWTFYVAYVTMQTIRNYKMNGERFIKWTRVD